MPAEVLCRLKRLEAVVFPNGYIEMPGVRPFATYTVLERLGRLENVIGI
jgi:hypothetical protein